jgi:hypothetical protein
MLSILPSNTKTTDAGLLIWWVKADFLGARLRQPEQSAKYWLFMINVRYSLAVYESRLFFSLSEPINICRN